MRSLCRRFDFDEDTGQFYCQQGLELAQVVGTIFRVDADVNKGVYNSGSGSNGLTITNDLVTTMSHVDFTLYVRFKCTPKAAERTIVSKGRRNHSSLNWNLGIVSSADGTNPNKLVFAIQERSGNDSDEIYSATAVTDNTYHHVFLTKENYTFKLYIDSGTEDSTKDFSTAAIDPAAALTNILVAYDGSAYQDHFTDGILAKYYAFAEALTPTQIANIISYDSLEEPSSSLIHEWRLEERGATTLDSIDRIAGDDGDPSGVGPTNDVGRFYRGRSCTATTQRLNCGNPADLQHTTGDFSFGFWFKASATSTSDRYLFSKRASGQIGYGVRIEASTDGTNPNGLTFFTSSDGSAETLITGATNVCDSTWHYATVTRDGTSGVIYIDGTSEASGSVPTTVHNSTADFVILNTADYTEGAVDCVINYLSAFDEDIGSSGAYNLCKHHSLTVPNTPAHEWLFQQPVSSPRIDTGHSLDRAHITQFADGTYVNNTRALGGWSPGFDSPSRYFDADMQPPDLMPTTEKFTVIFGGWLPHDQSSSYDPGYIFGTWGSSAGQKSWALRYDDNAKLEVVLSSDGSTEDVSQVVDERRVGGTTRSGPTGIQPKYDQIAMTRNGTSFKFYLRGQLLKEVTGITSLYATSTYFKINNIYSANNRSLYVGNSGAMDYVQFYYDRELTATEVRDKYFGVPPDVTEPYLDNRDPAPFDTHVNPSKDVYLEAKDTESDVDDDETIIKVDYGTGSTVTAYSGGSQQNGFTVSSVEDTEGGRKYYKYTVTPPSDFILGYTATVEGNSKDTASNELIFIYTFGVAEVYYPWVVSEFPTPGLADVFTDTNIGFIILNSVGASGIDTSSITVSLNGTNVIVSGVFQSGYDGSIIALTDGRNGVAVTLDPDANLAESTKFTIGIDAKDLATPQNVMPTHYFTFYTGKESRVKLFCANSMIETVNSYTSVLKKRLGNVTLDKAIEGQDSSNIAISVESDSLPTSHKDYYIKCVESGHMDSGLNVIEQSVEDLGTGQITYTKERVHRGIYKPPQIVINDGSYSYGSDECFGTLLAAKGTGVAEDSGTVDLCDRDEDSIFLFVTGTTTQVYSIPKVGRTDSNPVNGATLTMTWPAGVGGVTKISDDRFLIAMPSVVGGYIYMSIIDKDGNELEQLDDFTVNSKGVLIAFSVASCSPITDKYGNIYIAFSYVEYTNMYWINFIVSTDGGRTWDFVRKPGSQEYADIGNPLYDEEDINPMDFLGGHGYQHPKLYYDEVKEEFILTVCGIIENDSASTNDDAYVRFVTLTSKDFSTWERLNFPVFKNYVQGSPDPNDLVSSVVLTAAGADAYPVSRLVRFRGKYFAISMDDTGQYVCKFIHDTDKYGTNSGFFWREPQDSSGDSKVVWFDMIEDNGYVYYATSINSKDATSPRGVSVHALGLLTNIPEIDKYESAYYGYCLPPPSISTAWIETLVGSPTKAHSDDGFQITSSSGNYTSYNRQQYFSSNVVNKYKFTLKPITDGGPSTATAQSIRIKNPTTTAADRCCDVSVYVSTTGIRVVDNNGSFDDTYSMTIDYFIEILIAADGTGSDVDIRIWHKPYGESYKTWTSITNSTFTGVTPITRAVIFGHESDPSGSSDAIWKEVLYGTNDRLIDYNVFDYDDDLVPISMPPEDKTIQLIDNIQLTSRGLDSTIGDEWQFSHASDFDPNNIFEKKPGYIYRTVETSTDQRVTMYAVDDDIGVFVFDCFCFLNTNARFIKVQADDAANWTSPAFEQLIDFTEESGTIAADAIRQEEDIFVIRCTGKEWFFGEHKEKYVLLEKIFEPLTSTPSTGNTYGNVAFQILDNGPDYLEISTKGLYADEANGGASPGNYDPMKVEQDDDFVIYDTRQISLATNVENYRYISLLIESSYAYSDTWDANSQPSLPNERSWRIGEFDAIKRIEITENASYPSGEDIDSDVALKLEMNGQIEVNRRGRTIRTFNLEYKLLEDQDYETLVGIYNSINENAKPIWYAPDATEFPNKVYLVTSSDKLDASKILPEHQVVKIKFEEVK